MGGDTQLQHCDYTNELIDFLKKLEREGPDTELLIVGDTFEFWELTVVRGLDKFEHRPLPLIGTQVVQPASRFHARIRAANRSHTAAGPSAEKAHRLLPRAATPWPPPPPPTLPAAAWAVAPELPRSGPGSSRGPDRRGIPAH